MLNLAIPGRGAYALRHLVLDVNGTLAEDGVLLDGVAERLVTMQGNLLVHLLSADTFGRLDTISAQLGIPGTRLTAGEPEVVQKAKFVRDLGADTVVAIGNGANDASMLAESALGIVVLGPEGAAVGTLLSADVVTASINAALDLLLFPKRLIATLRQ